MALAHSRHDGLVGLEVDGGVIALKGGVEVYRDDRSSGHLDLRRGRGDEGSRGGDEAHAHGGRKVTGSMHEELSPAGPADDARDEDTRGGIDRCRNPVGTSRHEALCLAIGNTGHNPALAHRHAPCCGRQARCLPREPDDDTAAWLHDQAPQSRHRNGAIRTADRDLELRGSALRVDEHELGLTARGGSTAHEPPGRVRAQAGLTRQAAPVAERILRGLRGDEPGSETAQGADLQRGKASRLGHDLGRVARLRQDALRLAIGTHGFLIGGDGGPGPVPGAVAALEVGDDGFPGSILTSQAGDHSDRRCRARPVDGARLGAHRRGGIHRLHRTHLLAISTRHGRKQACDDQHGGDARDDADGTPGARVRGGRGVDTGPAATSPATILCRAR